MSTATGSRTVMAIASGKGGTGKTSIAVSLALSANTPLTLLDCDVEEPNAGILLERELELGSAATEEVLLPVPQVEAGACTGCGDCARICQFNAILVLNRQVSIFPDLCHSCGACVRVCPAAALREQGVSIGAIRDRKGSSLRLIEGELKVGKALSPPLIRAVRRKAPQGLILNDCPPGTSCPMVAAVRGADFVLLVTEPTPFGLHDLRLAVDTVRALGLPCGICINRADCGDQRVVEYCKVEGLPILAQIPNDLRIARMYAEGKSMLSAAPEYRELFTLLLERLIALAAGEGRA